MANEHLATDSETLFLEIITEERVLRLNKAIQLVSVVKYLVAQYIRKKERSYLVTDSHFFFFGLERNTSVITASKSTG